MTRAAILITVQGVDAEIMVHPSTLTAPQMAGEACIACGSTEQPLRPAGQVTSPGSDGVSHDWDIVRCWRDRHEAALLDPDDSGRRLWGIRDWHDGGRWVENGGDVERHPSEDGARHWIRGRRYLDEVYGRP